jgi:transcriptional regulator with XRE-family HTH domain
MAASAPGEVLGRQVRRWREERKLSAQALANRLAEIGSKLDRRAIFKIETENRSVSVDEWLQLAHALAVPPPLLLVDLDSGHDIAVAPQVNLHPWIVWGWIAGEHPSPVPSEHGGALISRVEEFGRAKTAVHLYRGEENAANAVHKALSAIRAAEYTGDEEALKVARTAHVESLRELASVLDAMVENSMTPPSKPEKWIEKIRALDLSKYPDRLQVFRGPVDDGPRTGDVTVMRPITPDDAPTKTTQED